MRKQLIEVHNVNQLGNRGKIGKGTGTEQGSRHQRTGVSLSPRALYGFRGSAEEFTRKDFHIHEHA